MARNTIGAACAALLLLTAAAPAGAAPVTLGSPLTSNFTQTTSSNLATGANTALPEPGAYAVSPIAGAVRRWRVQGTGTFTLRVLHPSGGGTFTSTAESAAVSATGPGTTVSTTALPIAVGDLIAIENGGPSDKIGLAGGPGAFYAYWNPALAPGEMRAPSSVFAGELAFNADVVPAPAVTAIVPGAGSVNGGTPVGIVGSDLTGASEVTFGTRRALSFSVDSDSSITAVAPPGAAGIVDVHVTTPSGTSATSDADRYAYLTAGPAAPAGRPAHAAAAGRPRRAGRRPARHVLGRTAHRRLRRPGGRVVRAGDPAGGVRAEGRRARRPRRSGAQGQEGQARGDHRRRAQGQDRLGGEVDGDGVAGSHRPPDAPPAQAPAGERHHGLDPVRRRADRPAGAPGDDQAALTRQATTIA